MYVTDAKQDQATELADLIHVAGEHLPFYLWQIESSGRSTPLEVGRKRIASKKEQSKFSYQNTRVCTDKGQILGASLAFKLSENLSLLDLHEHAEPLIPILMLETKAPGAWYVHTLSVEQHARHKGVATLLMRDAEMMAREHECKEIALIVNSANKPALSLYGALGYISKDQMPVVDYPNCLSGSHWVLLTLPIGEDELHSKRHTHQRQNRA